MAKAKAQAGVMGQADAMQVSAWVRRLAMVGHGTGLATGLDGPLAPEEGVMATLRARGLVARHVLGVGLLLVRGAHDLTAFSDHGPRRTVAIVGARAADAYGLALARLLGHAAVRLGFTVVSGGAEGVDAAAHEGALEAMAISRGSAATVVVMAGGHDHPYPAQHAALFSRVCEARGAVVAVDWPTIRPRRHTFVARNRVIAALSDAVVVVRAGRESGSLATARFARALGRPVAAVPGACGATLSDGCHDLLEAGATAVASPAGLAAFLAKATGLPVEARRVSAWGSRSVPQPAPWARDEPSPMALPAAGPGAAVLAVLGESGALDLDSLAERTNVPRTELPGVLLDLELAGWASRTAGGRFLRIC
jgi:DNA processing protein